MANDEKIAIGKNRLAEISKLPRDQMIDLLIAVLIMFSEEDFRLALRMAQWDAEIEARGATKEAKA